MSIQPETETYDQLLRRIRQEFDTKRLDLSVGPLRLQFEVVADLDKVLDQYDQQQPPWPPYWVESWESALHLAKWLTRDFSADGQSVLDLGCGLGLVGSVVAALGAQVTMVDVAEPALLFARANSWPWRRRVTMRTFDWRCDTFERRFDWIFGADIIYDRDDWDCLQSLWRRVLSVDGHVILTEPSRRHCSDFPQWLGRRGWKVVESNWTEDGASKPPIRLLQITSTRNHLPESSP